MLEAARRSGSLINYRRFAVEQGREVFAMPGFIHNPAAKSCHHVIPQGAKLVESVKISSNRSSIRPSCSRLRKHRSVNVLKMN